MMTSDFTDLATTWAHSGADGELHASGCSPTRQRTTRWCSAAARRPPESRYSPGATTSRLRDLGAHRVRIRRPGHRHRAEAHPPRRRRLCARRRLRLDDQPDRHFRVLPAVGALRGQRDAAAREPAVRRDAQRLPAGEGAGFVVLEEWESARRRGARIYAELAGDGNSLSSYRITDSPPDGDGPIQAMRAALADAGRCLRTSTT